MHRHTRLEKKRTFEDQDNFHFGQRLRSEPTRPKVVCAIFTSSLNTKRQSFALEKDDCPAHGVCLPGAKETHLCVTDETCGLFRVISPLTLCVSNKVLLYSSICFSCSAINPTAPLPSGCRGLSCIQLPQQARSRPGGSNLPPALPSLNWEGGATALAASHLQCAPPRPLTPAHPAPRYHWPQGQWGDPGCTLPSLSRGETHLQPFSCAWCCPSTVEG